MMTKRPRVAAIGLSIAQVASIAPLCGDLRPANELSEYLQKYSWTETDVAILGTGIFSDVAAGVNLITIGTLHLMWTKMATQKLHFAGTTDNTERELRVSSVCPDMYRPMATELCRRLGRSAEPSQTVYATRDCQTELIQTTSGRPVALRLSLPPPANAVDGKPPSIALLLPEGANLAGWFRALLFELHESDPARVPQAPPRLDRPSDWYTPAERALAERISQVDREFVRLSAERDELQIGLDAEGERADRGIRRALWADGDNLLSATEEMLAGLGFVVRNMDAELEPNEPKREDLRLTLPKSPGWEGIVEVKGYTEGVKTNDARQIREHRDRYIAEEGRKPNLTMWLSNPHRAVEPSSRPGPDQNVGDSAETIDAVHVVTSDLYRQWALVAAGILDPEIVVQSLVEASSGLWTPPVSPVTTQAPAG